MRVFYAVFGLLLALATSDVAEALERSPEELAVARELFEKAQGAERQEDWVACEEFIADAVDIIETPGLRFHLAYCKEKQQRWVEALVDYKRVDELVKRGVKAKDVEALLGTALARLNKQIPKLTISVESVPEGAKLFLDGKERKLTLLGKPIPVDPGGRRVDVSAPGHETFSQHVNLLAEDKRRIRVVLTPKRSAAKEGERAEATEIEPSAAAAEAAAPVLSTKAYVLIAQGVVTLGGVGMGLAFARRALENEKDRDALTASLGASNLCSGQPSTDALVQIKCKAIRTADINADNAHRLEAIGYIVGGVGLTALVTTWIVWPAQQEQSVQLKLTPRADGGWYSSMSITF